MRRGWSIPVGESDSSSDAGKSKRPREFRRAGSDKSPRVSDAFDEDEEAAGGREIDAATAAAAAAAALPRFAAA